MKGSLQDHITGAAERLASLSARSTEEGERSELITEAIEALSVALEEMFVAAEELKSQNEEILASREALEAERQRYLELFESAPVAYLVTDTRGVILEANRAAASLLGVGRRFLIGKPLLVRVSADEREAFSMRLSELAEPSSNGVDDWRFEIQPRRGAPTHVSATVRPSTSADGEVTQLRWAMEDADERHRVEQLKEDFSAMVSHELRSPITAILGYATLLEREEARADGGLSARAVAGICRRARDMERIVGDLLAASKIQSGRFELDLDAADIGDLVSLAVRSTRLRPRQSISVSAAKGVPEVLCDAPRIRMVLDNILSNAVKFSSDGSRIEVDVRRKGARVAISVTDHGVGMTERDAARIFERYEQVDMSSTRLADGVGLGLYIARKIVDAHDGALRVSSKTGKGSTFTVELPVKGPKEPRGASS